MSTYLSYNADNRLNSSPQYSEMLAKSRAEKRTAREARLNDSGEAFMPDDRSFVESTSTWGVVNVEPEDLADPTKDLRAPSSKLPWAICMSWFSGSDRFLTASI